MKLAEGPRPWSIWVFAASFCGVAAIGLYLALSDPFGNWSIWSQRLPDIRWTEDLALVASFSMFTIALIPIVWIFALRLKRARWVVLAFGLMKIGVRVLHDKPVISHGGDSSSDQILRLGELGLILIALVMLFIPASTRWLDSKREGEFDALN